MSRSKRNEVFQRLSDLGLAPQRFNYDMVVGIAVVDDHGGRHGISSPWTGSDDWWSGSVDEIVKRFTDGAEAIAKATQP